MAERDDAFEEVCFLGDGWEGLTPTLLYQSTCGLGCDFRVVSDAEFPKDISDAEVQMWDWKSRSWYLAEAPWEVVAELVYIARRLAAPAPQEGEP